LSNSNTYKLVRKGHLPLYTYDFVHVIKVH
jgi:hypothetical protein